MNINKTVMIHVAVEILAFSYLYSLVNKKTKTLEVEIEEMREDYEKKIDDLYEKVEILKNAIIQMTKPRNDTPVQQPQHHVQQPVQQSSKSIKKNVKTQENSPLSNSFVLPPIFMQSPLLYNNESEIKSAEVIEDNEEVEQEEKTEITDKDFEEIEQLIESSVE